MPPLDPHQRPPNSIRDVYKKYQRMKPQDLDDIGIVHIEKDLDQDPEIVHRAIHSSGARNGKVTIVGQLESELLTATFRSFAGDFAIDERPISSVKVYEHEDMPGKLPSFMSLLRLVVYRMYMAEHILYAQLLLLFYCPLCICSLMSGRPPHYPKPTTSRDPNNSSVKTAPSRPFMSIASHQCSHSL